MVWRWQSKRGMMDDLFDFLFTVFAALFLFLFVGYMLNGSIEEKQQQTVAAAGTFHAQDQVTRLMNSMTISQGVERTAQEYIVQFLEGRTVPRNDFEEFLSLQMMHFFPESAPCGYRVELYEFTAERRATLRDAFHEDAGKSGCPLLFVTYNFVAAKQYRMEMTLGR